MKNPFTEPPLSRTPFLQGHIKDRISQSLSVLIREVTVIND